MMFGNMPEFLGQIGGGGLIPIAFGSPKASPAVFQPAADLAVFTGVRCRELVRHLRIEGLPADLMTLWNKALRVAVAKPDMQKRFLDNGMDTIISSPDELKATIVEDRKKWAAVIQEAGMRRRLSRPDHGLARIRARRRCTTTCSIRSCLGRQAVIRSCFITASAAAPSSGRAGGRLLLIAIDSLPSICAAAAGRMFRGDFKWSLGLLVDDLFAVADAAGLRRFHLVGESIGGTVALAAVLARPERIATLTVSNGAHLGASIQRVEAWRRQLDEGGVKGWSDAFMPTASTTDALSPETACMGSPRSRKNGPPRIDP